MKKYLLPALWAALSVPAFSQQWRIAPTLGINLASASLSSAYENDLNSGTTKTTTGMAFRLQIGAFTEYAFTERFAVRSGLFYTPKGFSITATNAQSSVGTVKGSQTNTYLDIPLVANVAIGQKGFRVVGGPVFGIALGGRYTVEPVQYLGKTVYQGTTSTLTVGNNLNDGLLPTETSLLLGLIRERDRFGIPLELGLYSQIGLSNWSPSLVRQSGYSIRNSLVGLRLAYFFELNR